MFDQRQKKVIQFLTESGFDGLVLNAGPSLTYFSGLHFHLMERPVLLFLIAGKIPLIVLPELEKAKLDTVDFEFESYTYPDDPAHWPAAFKQACRHLDLTGRRIGFEPQQFRLLEYDYLRAASEEVILASAAEAVASCRAIKNQAEIEWLKKAVEIAQNSLEATLPLIKIGMSEKEVAAELTIQLFRHGSEQPLPFAPIVSTGANGANPHAKPSARRLTEGDLLIIDWGATWQGYSSDLTRTFGVGKLDDQAKRIHALVLEANETGRAAAQPGRACKDVDQATRSVIEAAGYGPCFSHRTGHGIGMECHEEPYIHSGNWRILEVGMTFTVEPGIYLSGQNGVRIEDDVLITADGNSSLSTLPRELIYINI